MAKEILGSGLFTIGFDGNLSGLNAYKNSLSGLQGPVKQIGLAFSSINQGTQNLTFNIKNAATHTQGMTRSMNAFAKEMFFTSTAINAINVALIGLNKGIADVSFGFDRNMTLIKSVTNASKSEFEDLGKLARELGAETEFGATKAAEGLLILSRAGLNANESMILLTPAVKLAQSQQEDMAMTTELLISQLRVFGKTVDDSADFANVLAATASKSAADLGTLNTALSYVGPIAATAGRGFEETNAALAIMFNNGLKASRVGTGLRFAMSNLLNPTDKVKKAIKSLGLTQEELTPSTNTLNDIFVKLADKMENVEDKASVLFNLFGQRASTAMGTVINTVIRNRDAFQQMQDSITDTDEITRQYEQQLQSFSGSALLLKSRIQEVGIALGENMMPAMRMVIESLTSLTEWFKGLSDGTKENIGKVLLMTTVTTTLAGALTGLLWVGGMVGKALTGMSKGYGALAASAMGTVKSFQANQAAQKAQIALLPMVDAALKKVVFTEMKWAAANAGVAKTTARRKALIIQDTIAQQDNSRSKLAAALIGARAIAQKKHMTKAEAAVMYATIRSTAAQGALQGAFTKTITMSQRLSMSLRGITASLGGPFGIIMTLATIAIPAFITATINAKAKQEEAKRVTKDQVEALTALNTKLQDVRASLDEMAGEQEKANKSGELSKALADRMKNAKLDELNIIRDIAAELPDLIVGYDRVTKKIILNEDRLREYITSNQHLLKSMKEIDKFKSGTSEERAAAIEKEIRNTEVLINIQAKLLQGQLKKAAAAKAGLDAPVASVSGSGVDESQTVDVGAINEAKGELKALEGSVSSYRAKINELTKALKALEAMLLRIKEAKAGGVDPEGDPDGLGGLGDDAEKAAKDLEAFLLSLEALRLKLEDITRARKRDSDEAALASDIDRQLLKNTNAALDEQANILRDLSAAREKYESLKRLKDEGKTIQAGDLEAALSKLRTLENETLRVFGAIDEKAVALNEKIIRDAVKAQGTANSKMASSLRKLELDLRGFLDNSLSYRLEVIDQEQDAALASVDEQISILQGQLSNEEKLRESQLKNISDLEYEKVLIVKTNAQKAVQAQIDALKASQTLDLLQMENSGAAPSQLIQQDIANKREYYEKLKELKSEDHEDTMAALKELRDAEKDGIQSSLDRWDKWGSTVASVISEVINDVDGLGEKLASSFISGGTAVVKGIASQNYAQAAAGIAEIGIAIKQFNDAVGEPSQASEATTESLDALNASAKELQFSFIEFARELLGLGKSTEGVEMALETAISNIARLKPSSGDARSVGVDESTVKSVLAALPTDLRQALEKGGAPAFYEFMDFARDVLASIDGNGEATEPTTYTAEALGMTPEAFTEFQKQLKSFLLGTGLAKMSTKRTLVGGAPLNYAYTPPEGLIESMGTALTTENVSNIRGGLYGGLGTGSLFSTSEEFIKSLRGMLDALKDSAFTLDVFGRSVVGYSDYLEVMNTVFEEGLANAKTEAEVNAIFAERANNLKFLAGSPLWQQVPDAEKIKLKTTVFNPDKVEADRQAAITKLQKEDPAAEAVSDSADKIETAFKDGAISFSEAISGLDSLEAKLGEFPVEVAEALKLSIDKARLAVLTGVQGQVAAAGASISEIQQIQENYLEALTDIDDKTKEVISTWDGLLADRKTVIDTFIQESAELKKESDARIATLEEERSATLGSFSFSDTQSVRSARFAKVGETEKKIQEETTKYYTDLIDMTVKYKEDLSTIDASVKELTDEYGTQAGVYTAFAGQRKDAETTYYDLLLKQRDALKEIGALVEGIDYTSISSLADSLVGIAERFQGTAPAGLDETVEALDNSIKDNQAEEALAPVTIQAPPSQTLTTPEPLIAPTTKTAFTKTLMPRTIMAETGFEGIVRKPTSFITGEHNKPEFVSVTPLSGLNRLEGGMAKSSTTNIVIHESIDLRGAYGITSPQVAQKVWNNVWAPARRRAVSRIMDTRGKVQR